MEFQLPRPVVKHHNERTFSSDGNHNTKTRKRAAATDFRCLQHLQLGPPRSTANRRFLHSCQRPVKFPKIQTLKVASKGAILSQQPFKLQAVHHSGYTTQLTLPQLPASTTAASRLLGQPSPLGWRHQQDDSILQSRETQIESRLQ